MKGRFRFSGGILYAEKRADNTEHLQKILQDGKVNKNKVERELDLLKRFPPNEPLTKNIFHVVEVYQSKNGMQWQDGFDSHGRKKEGSAKKAVGELEQILTINFGQELTILLGEEPYEEVVVGKNITHDLGKGKYIKGGTIVQRVPNPQSRLTEARRYFEINIVPELKHYAFRLDANGIRQSTKSNYPVFKITRHITFNDIEIDTNIEYARPYLYSIGNGIGRERWHRAQVRWHYGKS